MIKYIAKIGSGAETYYLKDIEARASIDDKPDADDFENLGDALTIQTVDDAIAEAEKSPSVISFSEDTASVDQGSTITKTVIVTAGDGAVTYSSSDTDIATVNNSGVVTGVSAGTCTITASIASTSTYKAATASYTVTVIYYDPYNGHDYVEIGGIKWATMNVGANSITDAGLHFQWGDIQGYTDDQVGSGSGKKYFGWKDYKYGNAGSSTSNLTKYNSTDGKTVLEAGDDAVTAAWGGQWRMPTTAEFQALGNAVNTKWTTNYQGSGVAGLVCTSKADSSKVLFFPTCGFCLSGDVSNTTSGGYYWSSSIYSNGVTFAYRMLFTGNLTSFSWQKEGGRQIGCSVRGVIG